MPRITTVCILAAGLGTRMLPATKSVPKEMLPIVDKPLIQYAVEEAVAAGMTRVVFVIAEGKEAIAEHFANGGRVERMLEANNAAQHLAAVRAPAELATFEYAMQDRPLGIAHALNCARHLLLGEPFGLVFPDDLLLSERPVLGQLAEAYEQTGGTVLAVMEVPRDEVRQYGVVDPDGAGNPVAVRGLVEKPAPEDAPSNLGIVGRYIIGPTIFDHIDRLRPGVGGELQITDAIASQVSSGEPVSAYRFEGVRHDTGRPLGYLAANIAAAFARPDLGAPLAARIDALRQEAGF